MRAMNSGSAIRPGGNWGIPPLLPNIDLKGENYEFQKYESINAVSKFPK